MVERAETNASRGSSFEAQKEQIPLLPLPEKAERYKQGKISKAQQAATRLLAQEPSEDNIQSVEDVISTVSGAVTLDGFKREASSWVDNNLAAEAKKIQDDIKIYLDRIVEVLKTKPQGNERQTSQILENNTSKLNVIASNIKELHALRAEEAEKMKDNKEIVVYTTQKKEGFDWILKNGGIISPTYGRENAQHVYSPTHAGEKDPDAVFVSEGGVYWPHATEGVAFVFGRTDILSNHQYFNGGPTGIRVFDSTWQSPRRNGASILFEDHPSFLILAHKDRVTSVRDQLDDWLQKQSIFPEMKKDLDRRKQWIENRVVDPDEVRREAQRHLEEYFKTSEGGEEKEKLQKEIAIKKRTNRSKHPSVTEYFERVSTDEGLTDYITNMSILELFSPPGATDFPAHYREYQTIKNKLKSLMSKWLSERLYHQFPDLFKGPTQLLPSGNFYNSEGREIPLYKWAKTSTTEKAS